MKEDATIPYFGSSRIRAAGEVTDNDADSPVSLRIRAFLCAEGGCSVPVHAGKISLVGGSAECGTHKQKRGDSYGRHNKHSSNK